MTSSDLQILKEQIDSLQELKKNIQTLRALPVGLLQPTTSTGSVTEGLKSVRGIAEEVLGEKLQGALSRAKGSLEADRTDLALAGRRDKRKPRPQTSAASPEIYVGKDRAVGHTSIFPLLAEEGVKMEGLVDWARAFNRTQDCKLRIQDKVLRLSVPEIMTTYMSFGVVEDRQIVVETIRVFGSREAKGGPHGQSGYTAFQQLSQELGKVLEQERVKLQSLVDLVISYSSLFITGCRVCGRVVSSERHVPAVVRRWENDGWVSEHVSCSDGPGVG
ncbi:hypothetical protein CPB83DRAFT_277985 [Crepidotus variabilis]|uniref:Uncharacterized protein n=1 Tax=Crepidotus variabilis TaxID=179855 RepID=A0A9P6EI64_9AGAR|nr:hypothetical protein CPB83DRAFT_277985 [Crepidotus variabilis]